MYIDLIVEALGGKLNKSDLKEHVSNQVISAEELNLKILSLICPDNIISRITFGRPQEMVKEPDEYKNAANIDNKIVTKILEEFYKIDYCPSFLYHQSVLHQDDFKFALEIYSKIFGIEFDEDCSLTLFNLFKNMYEDINLIPVDSQQTEDNKL